MNAEIRRLFAEYLLEAKDPVAAAALVLADVLRRFRQEPVIIEPDDRQTYGVKEAAELLHTSSKKVYQLCLAGKLRCVRIGGRSASLLTRSSDARPASEYGSPATFREVRTTPTPTDRWSHGQQKPPCGPHCPLLLPPSINHP